MVKSDKANRLVQISQQAYDVDSDRARAVIWIRAVYGTHEKSKMEVVFQTGKPIEPDDAFCNYPIGTIIRLD